MAGSVNKVILVGNLGKDPEIRRHPGRAADCQSERRDLGKLARQGDRRAQGKDRVASGRDLQRRLCKVAEQYLKKGAKVYIEGQLQTRKWTDQSGAEKYSTEVVLQGFNSNLTMLDGRSGGGGGFGSDDSAGDFGSGGSSAAPRRAVAATGARNSDMDDDIPF